MTEQSTLKRETPLPGGLAPAPATTRPRSIRPKIAVAALVALAVGAVAWRQLARPTAAANSVVAYGAIDVRQAQLAFNDNDRIARILVQEGDRVKKGQLLAELDTSRLQANVDKAAGDADAARFALTRLKDGSRPEEIAEARATLAAAQATEVNDRVDFDRDEKMARLDVQTIQARDHAEQALKVATATRESAEQALKLAVEGPRWEDIKTAEAQLQSAQAALAFARRQLADARLYAPADGVIEDRILEAGDMASPDRPALTLDLTDPVYARAYLPERELGRVAPGMRAKIESDAFPGKRFPAWIGFISTTAEFTPKTVETTDVRTELVYRMHVYACNPENQLRLGAPVTVVVPLKDNAPKSGGEHPCE